MKKLLNIILLDVVVLFRTLINPFGRLPGRVLNEISIFFFNRNAYRKFLRPINPPTKLLTTLRQLHSYLACPHSNAIHCFTHKRDTTLKSRKDCYTTETIERTFPEKRWF